MKTGRVRLSRTEMVLLAAAVLLPVPLFALSGLNVPLPGVVERGLGSFVAIEATDERAEAGTTGQASANGRAERPAPRAAVSATPGRRGSAGRPRVVVVGISSTATDKPAGESGSGTPAGRPEGAGEDGGAGSPGTPGSGPAGSSSTGGSSRGSGGIPGLGIPVPDQGSTPGIPVDASDLDPDVPTDLPGDVGAGSNSGNVGVDVTGQYGSPTGGGSTVPGVDVPLP